MVTSIGHGPSWTVVPCALDVAERKTKSSPTDLAKRGSKRQLICDGDVSLIRFVGHLPRGEYDVDHAGDEAEADSAQFH